MTAVSLRQYGHRNSPHIPPVKLTVISWEALHKQFHLGLNELIPASQSEAERPLLV